MTTRAYFGDGVYASFDGVSIKLTANGIGAAATDRVCLEPAMVQAMLDWVQGGYRDHSTGEVFGDEADD